MRRDRLAHRGGMVGEVVDHEHAADVSAHLLPPLHAAEVAKAGAISSGVEAERARRGEHAERRSRRCDGPTWAGCISTARPPVRRRVKRAPSAPKRDARRPIVRVASPAYVTTVRARMRCARSRPHRGYDALTPSQPSSGSDAAASARTPTRSAPCRGRCPRGRTRRS